MKADPVQLLAAVVAARRARLRFAGHVPHGGRRGGLYCVWRIMCRADAPLRYLQEHHPGRLGGWRSYEYCAGPLRGERAPGLLPRLPGARGDDLLLLFYLQRWCAASPGPSVSTRQRARLAARRRADAVGTAATMRPPGLAQRGATRVERRENQRYRPRAGDEASPRRGALPRPAPRHA